MKRRVYLLLAIFIVSTGFAANHTDDDAGAPARRAPEEPHVVYLRKLSSKPSFQSAVKSHWMRLLKDSSSTSDLLPLVEGKSPTVSIELKSFPSLRFAGIAVATNGFVTLYSFESPFYLDYFLLSEMVAERATEEEIAKAVAELTFPTFVHELQHTKSYGELKKLGVPLQLPLFEEEVIGHARGLRVRAELLKKVSPRVARALRQKEDMYREEFATFRESVSVKHLFAKDLFFNTSVTDLTGKGLVDELESLNGTPTIDLMIKDSETSGDRDSFEKLKKVRSQILDERKKVVGDLNSPSSKTIETIKAFYKQGMERAEQDFREWLK